jgi:hypothetical protein
MTEFLPLADAIGRHVHDGQSIALEGFTHLIPHAAGPAINPDVTILHAQLQLTALYPGVTVEAAQKATGWPLRVADELEVLAAPDPADLASLRDLHARTRAAHESPVRIVLPTANRGGRAASRS